MKQERYVTRKLSIYNIAENLTILLALIYNLCQVSAHGESFPAYSRFKNEYVADDRNNLVKSDNTYISPESVGSSAKFDQSNFLTNKNEFHSARETANDGPRKKVDQSNLLTNKNKFHSTRLTTNDGLRKTNDQDSSRRIGTYFSNRKEESFRSLSKSGILLPIGTGLGSSSRRKNNPHPPTYEINNARIWKCPEYRVITQSDIDGARSEVVKKKIEDLTNGHHHRKIIPIMKIKKHDFVRWRFDKINERKAIYIKFTAETLELIDVAVKITSKIPILNAIYKEEYIQCKKIS